MKRKFLNFCIGWGIAAALIFTSCDNFMNGSQLKSELIEVIEDANAERVNITISSLNPYGTLVGEKGGIYKVGDSNLSLAFEESDAYQFINWCVYDSNSLQTECSENDLIYIKDPSNPRTVFNVNGSCNNYEIKALCSLRPSIINVLPTDQTKGVSRDSSIIVTFDRTMSLDNFRFTDEEILQLGEVALLNDSNGKTYGYKKNGITYFKNIIIRNKDGNENLLNFFQAPQLNGEVLTITPKKAVNERFALNEEGFKDIHVVIEDNVYSGNLKIKSSKSWNYRASDFTDSQCILSITASDENGASTGILSKSGVNSFNIGETFELQFTPFSEYYFIRWKIEGNTDEIITYENGTNLSITVLKAASNVTVSPVCRKLESSTINFTSDYGSISPTGYQDYLEGTQFPISFSEGEDYLFEKWIVTNRATGNIAEKAEYEKYFIIENIYSANTSMTIKLPSSIYAVGTACYKRPTLIQHIPADPSVAVDRDTKIQLFFDQDIKGVNYTSSEILFMNIAGYELIRNEKESVIAYRDVNGIHYKNIEITDYVTGKNLAEHFYSLSYGNLYDPDRNKDVYSRSYIEIIPKADNLPPAGSIIKVELGTKFYSYPEDGDRKLLYLSPKNLVFIYQIKKD